MTAGDALADRGTARATHRVDAVRATTVRALGRDREVCFRGGRPYRGAVPMTMLAPHVRVEAEQRCCLRGAADGLALRIRLSDTAVHLRHRPDGDVARLVFDQLEQFRVESLVPRGFAGVAGNVRHRVEHWLLGMDGGGLTHTEAGLLLHSVAAMTWSHLTGCPLPGPVEESIEPVRAALAAEFGPRTAHLRRLRSEQGRFAIKAAEFATGIACLLGDPGKPSGRARSAGQRALSDLLGGADAEGTGVPAAVGGGHGAAANAYRIFTTVHDRERAVVDLVRPAQQREFRRRLDELGRRARINRPKLLRELAGALLSPTEDGWTHGLDSGHVDGRRLATLIASPGETRIFRDAAVSRTADVSVTFLLDCSGSMKRHIPLTAVLVDALARALDEIGATTEVLGFSTAGWDGGRSRREWTRAGRPGNPGRLNDRLHLIFKSADASWRHARRGIAGLFKQDLFREGLGGEALRWATRRARAHGTGRSVVVFISDGSPSDSASAALNPDGFLDADLVRAVADAEAHRVEVRAWSLGVDLSHFFPRSLVLPAQDFVDQPMLDEAVASLKATGD
ncbi:cobalt chelatase [Amycolatopsis sp. K13G38]|uniref:Cobalt chelatase n=1 Tax=Amycolatopsis acididurans TaxID=2724524 RepID=A0ABX1IY07_9PSEU|nr:cobalt chelatase [Amycolatopsis acididurans]NKQ52386.1 cobalt chelatase [Amycolatopsis acididurans]